MSDGYGNPMVPPPGERRASIIGISLAILVLLAFIIFYESPPQRVRPAEPVYLNCIKRNVENHLVDGKGIRYLIDGVWYIARGTCATEPTR